ncbi:MerR family transcriptional regulator [Novosphingobium aerophilum]|uniref:MerR family transcriptional regulator n=1 Tax=Novosphingobium TaxID=165696 RepID=UPI001052EE9A|nr:MULTISPECIES: MerR family transcriptional regulator [unclassified Novosphingobium]MPS69215.1 MerR family transcriptional regulator [Novosphingobium sp.]TCM42357.1 MerR family transcriptional regulator [Novosphingobium sp. ST904]WRT91619.1 MerR family transcriptional regulator [Novosphingobium sp. RL4]
MALTISELARSSGVGVETVRFYQRKGLLFDPRPAATGGVSGQRHYGEEDVKRLRFIRSAKAAGFILDEIAELISLDHTGDRPRAREMAQARLVHLDQEIAQLEGARQSLRKLARECAGSDIGPCPILEAFEDNSSSRT